MPKKSVPQSRSRPPVTLDELASGKLPEKVIRAIGETEITIDELVQWQKSKPSVRLVLSEKAFFVEMRVRVPIKKAAIVSTITGIMIVVVQAAAQNPQLVPQMIHLLTPH